MNNVEQQILDFINKDYSRTTFATRLYELFCKHDEAVKAYIKVGRKFWHYDGEKMCWRKLTVTYLRSGVMFFVFDDEPDAEQAWFMGSMNCLTMHAAEIYPYEIGDILSEWYPETGEDFPNICKQCKWDNCDGEITVEVIWGQHDIQRKTCNLKEITEDYISYETAKLLKEKGFIIPYDSFRGVYINGKFKRLNPGSGYGYNSEDEIITVCSLQMAMKWLRENYNIHINLDVHWLYFANALGWMYIITKILENGVDYIDSKGDENDKTFYSSYEEACEGAIKYCLENLI